MAFFDFNCQYIKMGWSTEKLHYTKVVALYLLFKTYVMLRSPTTPSLPHKWYNIHLGEGVHYATLSWGWRPTESSYIIQILGYESKGFELKFACIIFYENVLRKQKFCKFHEKRPNYRQITYEKITLRNELGKNCDMNALERTTSLACPGWILYVCVVVMANICAPGRQGTKLQLYARLKYLQALH